MVQIRGLQFNPHKVDDLRCPDADDKSGGVENFTISNGK
jgi:hypothetical protein